MTRPPALALAAVAAALAGCVTVLPKAPPVQLYRFGAGAGGAVALAAAVAPAAGVRSVTLGAVTLPRAAAGDGLLTVTGDEAAYVAGARWVSPAAILLREAVARALAARPGLRLAPSDAPADARLDLAVADFQAEYAAPGAAPAVRLALVATLTPRAGPPRTRAFAVSRPAGANRISAIVPAYDAAVRDVLGEVAAWVETETAAAR